MRQYKTSGIIIVRIISEESKKVLKDISDRMKVTHKITKSTIRDKKFLCRGSGSLLYDCHDIFTWTGLVSSRSGFTWLSDDYNHACPVTSSSGRAEYRSNGIKRGEKEEILDMIPAARDDRQYDDPIILTPDLSDWMTRHLLSDTEWCLMNLYYIASNGRQWLLITRMSIMSCAVRMIFDSLSAAKTLFLRKGDPRDFLEFFFRAKTVISNSRSWSFLQLVSTLNGSRHRPKWFMASLLLFFSSDAKQDTDLGSDVRMMMA